MTEQISRKSIKQLMAYSAAAAMGAFAVGQPAQGAIRVVDNWDKTFTFNIALFDPTIKGSGDDTFEVNWDAGQATDLLTATNNSTGIDHVINAGSAGNQFRPWCDLSLGDPGCWDQPHGTYGITSYVFSAQTYLDTHPTNELLGNAVFIDQAGPNAFLYSNAWINNTYYTTGFGADSVVNGTSYIVGQINNDNYSGFLTARGSYGIANPPDPYTSTLANPYRHAITNTIAGDFVGFSFEGTDGTHFGWAQIGLQQGPGLNMSVTYHAYAYEQTAGVGIRTPIKGDLNFDGFVGIDDLNIMLANWNQTVPEGDWGSGDLAGWTQPLNSGKSSGNSGGDGFVGVDDLNVLLANWNSSSAPPSVASLIPEPASLILLAAGTGALGLRRRR